MALKDLFKEKDINQLYQLFVQAAQTERLLPEPIRRQKLTSWPDYKVTWSAFGWDKTKVPKLTPTPKQIDDYDKVLELSYIMTEEDRNLIWAVAHSAAFRDRGANWHMVGRVKDLDHRTIKRRFMDAMYSLYYKLHELKRSLA